MTIEQQPELDAEFDEATAVPDPHYLELLRSSKLPQAYMPAMMGGPKKAWIRISSMAIIGIFLLATTLGICLTYGPGA